METTTTTHTFFKTEDGRIIHVFPGWNNTENMDMKTVSEKYSSAVAEVLGRKGIKEVHVSDIVHKVVASCNIVAFTEIQTPFNQQ